jgi:23S rRNA pseudouridine1911/1915/1917 synthase
VRGLVILYQDASMLVVEKPAGMHCAPLRPGEKDTLLHSVIEVFPEIAGLPGVKDIEPGLVHRIDRDTSGAVVIARTRTAFESLRASFEGLRVSKTYCAGCAADDPRAGAALSAESRFAPFGIGRKMVRVVLADERSGKLLKAATATVYRTEAVLEAARGNRAIVRAVIQRGFRHQVRAHLAYLRLPILGDPLYGVPVPAGREERMYLHAQRIELPHPETGERLVVESPVPPCFASLLKEDNNGIS